MKHVVLLNGGLGNQLFQIAALFAGGTEHEMGFESSIGSDKHASFMGESLRSVHFPKVLVEVRQRNLVWVKRRLANFLLKNATFSVSDRMQVPNHVVKEILSFLIYAEERVKYEIITESTMDTFVNNPNKNYFLIGYFQSSRWARMKTVEDQFQNMDFRVSNDAQNYAEGLRNQKTLGLHFRIGDYVVDSDMYGVLPNSYYSEALGAIKVNPDRTILFSDSALEASDRLLNQLKVLHDIVPISFSASETIYLMTACHSLVIANSSLSWWGAKIGSLKGATKEVIAPNPWFRLLSTEQDLIDDNWRTVTPWNQL